VPALRRCADFPFDGAKHALVDSEQRIFSRDRAICANVSSFFSWVTRPAELAMGEIRIWRSVSFKPRPPRF